MDIKSLLEQINLAEESVVLTPELVKKIFDAAYIDYEPEADEKIKEYTYKTMFDEYKYYGLMYSSDYIMTKGDYESLKQNLADELAQCLPDDFDKFFDSQRLYQAMDDQYYVEQTIRMINKLTEDDRYIPIVHDEATVDGVDFVIFEEKIAKEY